MQSLYVDFFEFLQSYEIVYACVFLTLSIVLYLLSERLNQIWHSIICCFFILTSSTCILESYLLLKGFSLFKFFKPFDADIFMFFLALIIAGLSLLLIIFQGIRWQVLKKQGLVEDSISLRQILVGLIGLVLTFLLRDFKFGMLVASFFLGIQVKMRRCTMFSESLLYLVILMYVSPILLSLNQLALLFWLSLITLLGQITLISYTIIILKNGTSSKEEFEDISKKPSVPIEAPENYEIFIRICVGLGVFLACILTVFDSSIHIVHGFKLNRIVVRAVSLPLVVLLFYAGMTLTGHKKRLCIKAAFIGGLIWWATFLLWSYYDICNPVQNNWSCR